MRSDSPADSGNRHEVLSTREGYDRWAGLYDQEDNPLIAIEEPVVAGLLGDIPGLHIADVGCGTGRHALRLAADGAVVTALDFSEGMLVKAMAKPGADAVRFIRHDLAEPLPLPDGAFDRVLCCLVLDHIPGLASFFGELKRICRPDGFAVVTVMHPAMMLRGVQARFVDQHTGREVRPASCPHQISDYVMAALHAGFHIKEMKEYPVTQALADRMPRAAKYLDWPVLLVMLLD